MLLFTTLYALLNSKDIFQVSIDLFWVIDAVGCIPLFLRIHQKGAKYHPRKIVFYGFLILMVAQLLLPHLLMMLRINMAALRAAGSLILFAFGTELLFDRDLFKPIVTRKEGYNDYSLVPYTFPLLIGPGTIAKVLGGFPSASDSNTMVAPLNIWIAIALNLLLVFIIFRYLQQIYHLLGDGGMLLMQRISGLILWAMAIQGFVENLMQLIFLV